MPSSHVSADTTFTQVFNLRDLGGLPAADGHRVQRGRLFRSDSPHRATVDDLAVLQGMDLNLVLDLREHRERQDFGIAADEVASRRAHLPVFDITLGDSSFDDGMAAAARRHGRPGEYLFMLEHGADTFVEALQLLATDDHLPALFHCAVGKDRTGVLAALVLTLVGVPEDEVAADYARSHPGMVALTSWAEQHEPEYGQYLRAYHPDDDAPWTTAEMMHDFLALVADRHGSLEDFVTSAGLPDDVPGRLRDLLLD